MTNMELILNMLAEASSTEISKNSDGGYENVKNSIIKGGNVAKNAREEIERQTGKKITTSSNNKNIRELVK